MKYLCIKYRSPYALSSELPDQIQQRPGRRLENLVQKIRIKTALLNRFSDRLLNTIFLHLTDLLLRQSGGQCFTYVMIPLLPLGIVHFDLRFLRVALFNLFRHQIRSIMIEYRELVLLIFYQFVVKSVYTCLTPAVKALLLKLFSEGCSRCIWWPRCTGSSLFS